jgi:hypothetical protein
VPDWSDTLTARRNGLVPGFVGKDRSLTAADLAPAAEGTVIASDGKGGFELEPPGTYQSRFAANVKDFGAKGDVINLADVTCNATNVVNSLSADPSTLTPGKTAVISKTKRQLALTDLAATATVKHFTTVLGTIPASARGQLVVHPTAGPSGGQFSSKAVWIDADGKGLWTSSAATTTSTGPASLTSMMVTTVQSAVLHDSAHPELGVDITLAASADISSTNASLSYGTDDTAAFNQAKLVSNEVLVPLSTGPYMVAGALDLSGPITLRGYGWSPSSNFDGVRLLCPNGGPTVGRSGATSTFAVLHNISIDCADSGDYGIQVGTVNVTQPAMTISTSGAGGTLGAGSYNYKVTAVTNYGRTNQTGNATQIVGSGTTNTITVSWTPPASDTINPIIGYEIYGRTAGTEQLLATVGPGVTSWVDTGAAVPSGAFSTSNTSAGSNRAATLIARQSSFHRAVKANQRWISSAQSKLDTVWVKDSIGGIGILFDAVTNSSFNTDLHLNGPINVSGNGVGMYCKDLRQATIERTTFTANQLEAIVVEQQTSNTYQNRQIRFFDCREEGNLIAGGYGGTGKAQVKCTSLHASQQNKVKFDGGNISGEPAGDHAFAFDGGIYKLIDVLIVPTSTDVPMVYAAGAAGAATTVVEDTSDDLLPTANLPGGGGTTWHSIGAGVTATLARRGAVGAETWIANGGAYARKAVLTSASPTV